MGKNIIAALAAAQLALMPVAAAAADLEAEGAEERRQMGAFAGARLRVALGSEKPAKPSLGLGISGMAQSRAADGAVRTRFSEGVQLGYSGTGKLGLTLAGQPLTGRRAAAQDAEAEEQNDDDGISTLGWIGIGVGAALLAAGVGLALWADAISDNSE